MSDNYICYAYRRNNNNSVWAGTYLIVTSNLSFLEWLEQCHFKVYNLLNSGFNHKSWSINDAWPFLTDHAKAMVSRFYICRLVSQLDGTNKLVCDSVSTRGSVDDQIIRRDMFIQFQRKFNRTIFTYTPQSNSVDYSNVNFY